MTKVCGTRLNIQSSNIHFLADVWKKTIFKIIDWFLGSRFMFWIRFVEVCDLTTESYDDDMQFSRKIRVTSSTNGPLLEQILKLFGKHGQEWQITK